jgi:hypothetical protein
LPKNFNIAIETSSKIIDIQKVATPRNRSRVGNFRPNNYSAEDGIDGTISFFRQNSGYSAEQKIPELFHRGEK